MKNLVLVGLLLTLSSFTFAESTLGRFVGFIRHKNLNQDQLAKLDFIPSREEGNNIILKAILTVHFGDFKSGEYVAYHFDNVRYNILQKTFIFDQADQPVTLVGKLKSSTEFEGDFRSSYSGEVSQVFLKSDKPAAPTLPLIESIWGEYRGKCKSPFTTEKVDSALQLYTYRSTEGAVQVGNPFRTFKIKGFFAEKGLQSCAPANKLNDTYCIWGNIKTGSYNFYKKQLILFSNYKNMSCTVEPTGLKCNDCEFLTRVSNEAKAPKALTPPTSKNILSSLPSTNDPALISNINSIQGEYKGYLHHEYLDTYQLGSLNILTYQASEDPSKPANLRMSAVSTLYFGDETSAESISYRFKERSYPNPLTAPQFVFSQVENDVDAILQVTQLGKGIVKGIWFSQLFGKVGTFEFRKDGPQKLLETAKKMEPVTAEYESSEFELNLLVGMGTAAPNTENPFAPLTFEGFFRFMDGGFRLKVIGGSYDFYTGKIGFETDGSSIFIGERFLRKKLALKKMYYAPFVPLLPHTLQSYRIMKGS
jgi:hypothetical protein